LIYMGAQDACKYINIHMYTETRVGSLILFSITMFQSFCLTIVIYKS